MKTHAKGATDQMAYPVSVGDTIWWFDINCRKYPPREPGKSYLSSGPIYREHWTPLIVTGETSRSWITQRGLKCPKKGDRRGWALSQQEVDDDVWKSEHRHKIAAHIGRVDDPTLLRKVAALIGYDDTGTRQR